MFKFVIAVPDDEYSTISPLLNPLKFLTGKYKNLTKDSELTPSIEKQYSKKVVQYT